MKRFTKGQKIVGSVLLLVVAIVLSWSVNLYVLSPQEPEKFTIAFVAGPSIDPASVEEHYGPIMTELSNQLGMEVELLVASSYATTIEALLNGTADMARFGAFIYVQAHDEFGVVPLVREIEKGSAHYFGQIIAQPGIFEEPYTLEQIKGHTMAFVDPASTSGYWASLATMKDAGVTLDDLSEYYFAGSHAAVIEAVANGAVDVGATCDRRVLIAEEEGAAVEGVDFITLSYTGPLVRTPWCVLGDMDDNMKECITQILLSMPNDVLDVAKPDGFVHAQDSDYDFMRAMAEEQESAQ